MQKKVRKSVSKVDYRILYKRKVVEYLLELKEKDCTASQMDASMKRLFSSTDQVVPVCLSKLRENDEEFAPIVCYALEFADDYAIVEPLVRILIMPQVSDKVKARILGVLAHYGIDAGDLPLDLIMKDFEKMAADSLLEMLDDIDEDCFTIAYVLDDMEEFSVDMKISYVRDVARLKDDRSLCLLEIIASTEDGLVSVEAIKAMGKFKSGKALFTLYKLRDNTRDESLKKLIDKEIRRHEFRGVSPQEHLPPWAKLSKPQKVYISSIDGLGNRAIWMAWKNPTKRGRLGFMNLLLTCDMGIKDCWGSSQISGREFNSSVKDFSQTATIAQCDMDYAAALICDALDKNLRDGHEIPYQFHFWKCVIENSKEIKPKKYTPIFESFDLDAIYNSEDLLKNTFKLFDYSFFKYWFVADPLVYDYAEEHKSKRGFVLKKMTWNKAENLFSGFSKELIEPIADVVKRMLELSADFLCLIEEPEVAQITIAAFMHMDTRPLHYHPFIQRMVTESLRVALSNMKNGFDMREDPDAFV